MNLPFRLPVLIVLVVVAAAAAAEDLTVVSRVIPSKGQPMTATQYISANKVRSSDGQFDTIIDLESGQMIQVDHKKKSYFETSFEEMRAHFAELAKMLDDNPMMARMLGEATEVDVEKIPGTREIAGYTCRQYQLTMGENLKFLVWATPDLQPPGEHYDAQKMLYAAMGPAASRFEKMFDEMKKIGGFALSTQIDTRILGMSVNSLSEAVEVRRDPLPAEAFAPPAGYKKKKSPYGG
jgi:hypothetical protein